MPTVSDYWRKGIHLTLADWYFAPPSLQRKYSDAQAGRYECVEESVEEFITTIEPTAPEMVRCRIMAFRTDDGLIADLRREMRDHLRREIANGNLVLTGQDRRSGLPIKLSPDEFVADRQKAVREGFEYMDWDNSMLCGAGTPLINVRIARKVSPTEKRHRQSSTGSHAASIAKKKGRRSHDGKILGIYESSKAAGQIDFMASQKAAIDKIADFIVEHKILPKRPSSETIRKYIANDFNKMKRLQRMKNNK